MKKQVIFKYPYIRTLVDELVNGDGVETYYESKFKPPKDSEWQSTIEVPDEGIVLKTDENKNIVDLDVENAITLYESFENLTEVQASDERLWVHLCHVDLRDYVMQRWPLKISLDEIESDPSAKQRAINYVTEHWFVGGSSRGLRRNALARLWWATHLTVAPWERNPERFAKLHSDDKYKLTRTMFSTQDIFQQVLERSIGRDEAILVTVLDCIDDIEKAGHSPTRDEVRHVMKELNLIAGVSNLTLLEQKDLKALVQNLFDEASTSNE